MIYMIIFWILMVIIALYYFICNGEKNSKVQDNAFVINLLAISFLLVAIITKDPIFSSFGVPLEFEWIIGLFMAAFTSWRLYFNDLKKRVIIAEKDIVLLKNNVGFMNSDMKLIKEKLMKL